MAVRGRSVPIPAVISRGSLQDDPVAVVGPLVVGARLRWFAPAVVLLRAPVEAAPTPPAGAVTPRPFTGTTTRPAAGTTARPFTGITTRP